MKKREKLFSSSLEQASLEVFWITSEGDFVFTNENARDRLGYSKEELDDMHVWDIDPNYPKEKRKEVWESLKENKRLNFLSDHVKKNGEKYPVEITSQYIEYDGEEYELAFAKDITERREKESALYERVKELECLYTISNLTQTEDITIESLMQEVVDVVPTGFSSPRETSARIIFDDRTYESDDFKEGLQNMSESISADHGSGRLEVFVDKEGKKDEVFLEEEKDLVNSIAIHLENFIDRKMKVEKLEELIDLEML